MNGRVYLQFWLASEAGEVTTALGPYASVSTVDDRLYAAGELVAELLLGYWHLHAGPVRGSRWHGFRTLSMPVECSLN
jgi:hypothetical protein